MEPAHAFSPDAPASKKVKRKEPLHVCYRSTAVEYRFIGGGGGGGFFARDGGGGGGAFLPAVVLPVTEFSVFTVLVLALRYGMPGRDDAEIDDPARLSAA